MLYLDSSALVKRYVVEAHSELAESIVQADTDWITARHTYPEVAIALGRRLGADDAESAVEQLDEDWQRIAVVAIDDSVARDAATLGRRHDLRTLDALHLAAAGRIGARAISIVTFDARLAAAARHLGFVVLGA